MTLLGLLLIAVAAGFAVDVFVENSHDVDVDVLGRTFSVSPGWIVVAGIVALVTFIIGVRLVALGVRRARRRRAALRGAKSATRERDQLAQQLAAERERADEATPSAEASNSPAEAAPSSVD